MKTPKCPICGVPLKAIRGYDVQGITTDWVASCYNCFFQSSRFWKTKKACIEDMDRLVSLFPPFMRVWPGDKVKLYEDRHPKKIIGKNADRGILYLEMASGPPEPVRQDDVELWPWEIEKIEAYKYWELGQTEKVNKSCDNCKYCTSPFDKSPCFECVDFKNETYKYWELDQKGGNE